MQQLVPSLKYSYGFNYNKSKYFMQYFFEMNNKSKINYTNNISHFRCKQFKNN